MKQLRTTLWSNATKGWKTNVIGLALIIGATVSVFTRDSVTWVDASVAISIGIGLVFSPDGAVEKANKNILAVQGIQLASSAWLTPLGDGLYEFRIKHSATEIEGLYRAKNKNPPKNKSSILIREFIAFEKGKIIILLGAYDKGIDPSKTPKNIFYVAYPCQVDLRH